MDSVQRTPHWPGRIGPANWVTLTRAVLACVVLALVLEGLVTGVPRTGTVVLLSVVALALDAVDGKVARRTGTATAFGARFDMETDAFLIAVLSVHVTALLGWAIDWWVLLIGAMRYLHVAASRLLPWLRRPLPPRYSAKVVAAIQGIVLVTASTQLLPIAWSRLLLAVSLVLLVHSFGLDAWRLWRRRAEANEQAPEPVAKQQPVGPPPLVLTGLSVALLWLALTAPGLDQGWSGLLQIPVEGLILVGLALILPKPVRRTVAVAAGVAALALILLRALDFGFESTLARPFHLLGDWVYLRNGFSLLHDTEGGPRATMILCVAVGVVVMLLWLLPTAAVRVTDVAARHRRASAQALLALALAWIGCATYGGPLAPIAGAGATGLTVDAVHQVRADLRAPDEFADRIAADRYDGVPPAELLTSLRGKDVLLIWVESYGRVAIEGTPYAAGVREVLRDGDARLAATGYRSRSAFLTSPTFGGLSWLAHSTLQSGVRVPDERSYSQLIDSERLTLAGAFDRAGWETVFDVPSNTEDWPDGERFYGFDRLYDSRNVGYRGPRFGYARMPDQYTLDFLRRTELDRSGRRPVFAEIDLVSSHTPWTPLPSLVPWREVGDGSVFAGMPERARDPGTAQERYAASIEYTWQTLISFLETYPDPNRVVIIAGDHQPHAEVSGTDAGHDVPVTILSQDRDVLRRVADWQWDPGLVPSPDAPVWPMEAFRDRFLSAF